MHFTRARDLLLSGIVAAGVGLALFDLAYGSMQSIPRFAGGLLAIMALGELIGGFVVKDRIHTGRLTEAIVVSRVVVLAKASSQLGAIMLGVWFGALLYLVPRSASLAAAREDIPSAIIGAVCAAALVAAALWLEHCCRTPQDSDHGDRGDQQTPRN
ncbi:DUF3180 domain-containing protein [Haloechinothrix salitolerans]|uniref:DUF3180 domain-containing protein n=1 Tax=Haloechinothrix salitolerans TaxID=926830 RepID=A0ABW2BV21_9PSEU